MTHPRVAGLVGAVVLLFALGVAGAVDAQETTTTGAPTTSPPTTTATTTVTVSLIPVPSLPDGLDVPSTPPGSEPVDTGPRLTSEEDGDDAPPYLLWGLGLTAAFTVVALFVVLRSRRRSTPD